MGVNFPGLTRADLMKCILHELMHASDDDLDAILDDLNHFVYEQEKATGNEILHRCNQVMNLARIIQIEKEQEIIQSKSGN